MTAVGRPRVREESEHWYVDKFRGARLSFQPKPDELVVTFTEDAAARTAEDVITRLTAAPQIRSLSRGADVQRGFAVVHPAERVSAAEVAASVDRIANAQPAFIDPHGLTRFFLPDEFTVQFRADVSVTQAEEIIDREGGRVLVRQRTPGYYTVGVPEGAGPFATIRRFTDLPEVAFVEPSEVIFDPLTYVPNDPDFGLLWGMRNTGQTVNGVAGTAGQDIAVTSAWDLHRGDPSVIIAVLDTGADLGHPDLAANILPRGLEDWDFRDSDQVPDDLDGHGTHVAGTAAAVDNAVGVIGVAPMCRIMPLRMLRPGFLFPQQAVDAINYVAAQAVANRARRYVINCSWRSNGDVAAIHNAIINAVNSNVVVCFAAGNDNINTDVTPIFPGVYPEVIGVAALDQNGRRAITSNFASNFGTNVDVSAPGVNIYSTLLNGAHGFNEGTSMASPHVAGLAALVWSASPTLSNAEVRLIIEETCVNIDTLNPGFAGLLGRGRVNAFDAVTLTPILAQFAGAFVPSVPALT